MTHKLMRQQRRHEARPRRPAICLFTDSLEPSGVGEHMLALAGQLLAAYPILFVCPPTAKRQWVLERARQLGCQVLALEVRGDPAAAAVLRKQLRVRGVQVFHCHAGIGGEGHAGVYAARRRCAGGCAQRAPALFADRSS